jgi:DNA-binding transcriptional LysR family regulator
MNEYLATKPFDLYELQLFHLVVKHRSFTKAAEIAGLTQSAITRQVQGMESRLGVGLLERTTRSVSTTPAGEFLVRESAKLLGDVENSFQRLREEFAGAKKQVRVGVSRSIGLAYLPGFFHANLRRAPNVGCHVSHRPSKDILSALENNELDIGVLCPPARLPHTVRVTHKFEDAFTLIAPTDAAASFGSLRNNQKVRSEWMSAQNWLVIEEGSNTGKKLRSWMTKEGWQIEPIMELDNFDLIINLVALGLGIGFVPVRALALYGQKKNLVRLDLRSRFVRELVVVIRKHRKVPQHLDQFVQNILF